MSHQDPSPAVPQEPRRHRCMRCNEVFACQHGPNCSANFDVMPTVVFLDAAGHVATRPHCPQTPDWEWVRSYGDRMRAQGHIEAATAHAARATSQQEPAQHLIDLAVEVSGWSPCQSKRGVVIFAGEDVIAHGYNYKPRGFDCDGTDTCKATCGRQAVHAEQQALLSAGVSLAAREMLHVKTVKGRLVASGGPSCVECSKLALASGIRAVWLYHADGWRRYEMAEFHRLSLTSAQEGALIREQQLRELITKWRQEAAYGRLGLPALGGAPISYQAATATILRAERDADDLASLVDGGTTP